MHMRPAFSRLVLSLAVLMLCTSTRASAQTSPTPAPKPAQLPADSMEIGRRLTQWMYTAQADSVISLMDADTRAHVSKAEILENSRQLALRVGSETKLIEEKYITRNGNRQYWRVASFSNFAEPVVIRFVITPKGELIGMGMNPLSKAPPIDP